jgi:hypothetical protein
MRSIQKLCAAFGLTIILAISAFAGDMLGPGLTATGEMSTPGVSATGDIQAPGVIADPTTEVALGFLLDVLSLI